MGQRFSFLPADLLGLDPPALDALSGRFPEEWLRVPRTLDALQPPLERHDEETRAELAAAIESGLAPLGPPVGSLDAARALARPGTHVVLAAARPGLMVSPLAVLAEAARLVALARALTEHWERPVVPVLWNDADVAGAAAAGRARILNRHADLQEVLLADLPDEPGSAGELVLVEERHRLAAARALLLQLHGDHAFIEPTLERLFPRPGETLARAFTRGMLALLGHRGLLVLEPQWVRPALSQTLAVLVGEDLREEVSTGLAVVADRYPSTAPDRPGAVATRLEGARRVELRLGGEGVVAPGEPGEWTLAELAAEIVQEPARYRLGPLLAPLVLESLLPIAALVGSTGNLVPLARLTPARLRLGLAPPVFIPRAGLTVVDPELAGALARTGLAAETLLRAGEAPEPAPQEEAEVIGRLRAVARDTAEGLLALREELAALDPGLAARLRRVASETRHGIERLAVRAQRADRNARGKQRRHLLRVRNALLPDHCPQERVLGPLPWLARFGDGWVEALCDELDPLAAEHVLLHLEEDGPHGR